MGLESWGVGALDRAEGRVMGPEEAGGRESGPIV